MNRTKMSRIGPPVLMFGVLFMVIGFLQEGMRINFGNPLFSVGFIFLLSGLVGLRITKKRHE